MTTPPETAAKNSTYDLLWALETSLRNVWQMENYALDAERQGDGELHEWFRKIQHNNQKAADQGKQLLINRWQRDGS